MLLASIKEMIRRHALVTLIALGMGLQAFGTGFYDNFWPVEPEDMARLGWWQVTALVLKSMSFAIGIVVGYLIKPAEKSTPPASAK